MKSKSRFVIMALLALANPAIAKQDPVQALAEQFAKMVVPEKIQNDPFLLLDSEILVPGPFSDTVFGQDVLMHELSNWEGVNGVIFKEHIFDFSATLDTVMASLFVAGASAPWFCENFLAWNSAASDADALASCQQLTRELLSATYQGGNLSPISYSVVLDGDVYGDYRLVVLYVRSSTNPNIFARIAFDIYHEI